jgi:hypothetical protein
MIGALTFGLSTTAFADGTTQANSILYMADLTTGKLSQVGRIGNGVPVSGIAVAGQAQTVYAVTTTNQLVTFNADAPNTIVSQQAIMGLQSGETLLGIDVRPANGGLYALGSTSRVYTLDPATAMATAVGAPFTPALSGTSFGFDFNPTVDRIRVVSNTGQNLRLNPDTGAVGTNPDTGAPTIDGRLAYAAEDANAGRQPSAVGAGYTNSVAGATSTQLFVIDAQQGVLALQNPPNEGVLNTVGALGVTPTTLTGFDIAPSGMAYVAITSGAMLPTTGAASNVTLGLVAGLALIMLAVGMRSSLAVRSSSARTR